MEKITLDDLMEKLRDLETDETSLAKYFLGDKEHSKAFSPNLKLNPEKVEISEQDEFKVEAAFAFDWLNGIAKWRRRKKFERRIHDGDRRPVLISEGDSWFQFPLLLKDVIDHLNHDYSIYSVGSAGDTLENMVNETEEYLEALDQYGDIAKAFLFSGGGNDIVGEDRKNHSVLEDILLPYQKGEPAIAHINETKFSIKLAKLEEYYRTMIQNITDSFPELPILIHGYANTLPGGSGSQDDKRDPIYADQDQWVGQYLRGKTLNIIDTSLQCEIIAILIDRFNSMQQNLANEFANVWHIDARDLFSVYSDWNDELHPTNEKFAKVANRFKEKLKEAGV